jgi:EAL domain-containing protein (putative c-di-GMP-specific phosphodiesterase class I)
MDDMKSAPGKTDALHWKRANRMLTFVSYVAATLGAGWGAFAIYQPNHLITVLAVLALAMAAVMFRLLARERIKVASYLFITVVYAILIIAALHLGILHQFFLPLAVCSFLLMRDDRSIVRHGAPLICLATFGWLSCAVPPLDSIYALSPAIRSRAVWMDQALAILTLYVCMKLAYDDVIEQTKMELELRDALIKNQLVVFYQPQVDDTGAVVGAEALLRWQHPARGLVPPNEFIPIAESSGLMIPIGDWVLRTACAQVLAWRSDPDLGRITVAVNVSASQFADERFVRRVADILEQTGVDPLMLKLELTETVLVENIEEVIEKMQCLRQQGIRLSLDDFGTGFSSLNYLRRLPLDQVKVDQSFVRNMLVSSADAVITRTVITLGTDLELEVIAEGVETERHRAALLGMGCRLFQGYFFSRPITVPDLESLVRQLRSANPRRSSHDAFGAVPFASRRRTA